MYIYICMCMYIYIPRSNITTMYQKSYSSPNLLQQVFSRYSHCPLAQCLMKHYLTCWYMQQNICVNPLLICDP